MRRLLFLPGKADNAWRGLSRGGSLGSAVQRTGFLGELMARVSTAIEDGWTGAAGGMVEGWVDSARICL